MFNQITPMRTRSLDDIFSDFPNKDESCSIYVDGANLHCSAREIDLKIDYRELKSLFEKYMTVRSLNYFASLPSVKYQEEDIHCHARKLSKWLAHNGWRIHTNEATVKEADDGKYKIVKANVDTDLAATAVDDVHCSGRKIDRIILFSGDKDFSATVKILRRYARVTIVSNKNTLSSELKEVSDSVIYLEDLKSYIDDRRWLSHRENLHEDRKKEVETQN